MRVALGIEYDGTNYYGWQRQQCYPSIQSALETALAKVGNEVVVTVCAGRTDRGVHALEQVVHFDTKVVRTMDNWVSGTNANLPPDIRILWARQVDDGFHARYTAISRRYRYVIHNYSVASALLRRRVMWYRHHLDEQLMEQAGAYLIGEHNFSSFRGSGCQSVTPYRNLLKLEVSRNDNIVHIDLEANAFLLHMARNITGSLIQVGAGFRSAVWIKEVLEACDRRRAGITAPSWGLYLVRIEY